ncbi:unnamed protein product [Urochloa humidicola]
MGALYPLGAGTRQLRAFSVAGQCRSNRSPRSVEGSRLISAWLSRQGMYSLMLSGQTGNLPIRTLGPLVPPPASPGSCGAGSSVARSVSFAPTLPTSKSSRIAPSSPTMPRRAGGGGGRRGGGGAGVGGGGGGSDGGGEALGVGEAGGAVAASLAWVGIRDGSKETLELGESATAVERGEEPVADEVEAEEEEKKTRRGEASGQW